MKILLVCLGNICRSPLAEGILQHKAKLAGLDWEVDSAGTNGFHNGEAPHPLSQKVASLHQIDISAQRSRKFKLEDIAHFDKIYAMAADVLIDIQRITKEKFNPQKVELFLNEIHPGKNEDVPDPWHGQEDGYHHVFEIINEACDVIIEKYKQQ